MQREGDRVRNQEPAAPSRRNFLRATAMAASSGLLPGIRGRASANHRPNILWISAEDISPDLGCYGDSYAHTPNIDRFAAEGALYERCFSISGVCAPSRSAIITGMYPTTIGTMNMRTRAVPPPEVRCFPEYLRAAGYYCTNNSKTDYQFEPPVTAWDESSSRAHWRTRLKDQPFFSVSRKLDPRRGGPPAQGRRSRSSRVAARSGRGPVATLLS